MRVLFRLVSITAILVLLPLAGVLLNGGEISLYLEFPPLTRYVAHAPFSWSIFLLLTIFTLSVCFLFFKSILQVSNGLQNQIPKRKAFPAWGIVGFALTGVSWFLAWTRFPWVTSFQEYTFFPLWIGYIISVNGITFYRSGRCLLTHETGYFITLFPFSALFWWFFEYLNRFVQNWYYIGVEEFTAQGYVLHASFCFSTVLPAVLSTQELLATNQRLNRGLQDLRSVAVKNPLLSSWGVLTVAGIGLLCIGIKPDLMFPLVWISPCLIILSVQGINRESTILKPVATGDWRPVVHPALGALFCGFFWELWNYKSFAHWEYSVPYVHRFLLFEMPVIGYAGYLPFGLECAVIAALIKELENRNY